MFLNIRGAWFILHLPRTFLNLMILHSFFPSWNIYLFVDVYYEIHSKSINISRVKFRVFFFTLKRIIYIYSYHCALKVNILKVGVFLTRKRSYTQALTFYK
jgi:hypothetical protein